MPLEPEVPDCLPRPPRDAPWDWAVAADIPPESEAAIERLHAVSQWHGTQILKVLFAQNNPDESRLQELRAEREACRADLETLWTAEPLVAIEIGHKWS
ncbi:hypothetical protein OIU91_42485 (plasmid) [Streptomyces sp. NBC_01456]|uniref:hypothetical protein n=1 Tax=unclassified Streptomyces TaxID=2593676 RepID=UPI002E32FF1E|nr:MULTISPECIES: hypothetical protein [unclassified Streptomyces]